MQKLAALSLVIALSACQTTTAEPDPYVVHVAGNLGAPIVSGTTGDVPQERTVSVEEGNGRQLSFGRDILFQITSFDDRGEKLSGGQLRIEKFSEDTQFS